MISFSLLLSLFPQSLHAFFVTTALWAYDRSQNCCEWHPFNCPIFAFFIGPHCNLTSMFRFDFFLTFSSYYATTKQATVSFAIKVRTAIMLCRLGIESKSSKHALILSLIFCLLCRILCTSLHIEQTGNAKVTCVNPINLAAEELYNCAGEGDRAVQCA